MDDEPIMKGRTVKKRRVTSKEKERPSLPKKAKGEDSCDADPMRLPPRAVLDALDAPIYVPGDNEQLDPVVCSIYRSFLDAALLAAKKLNDTSGVCISQGEALAWVRAQFADEFQKQRVKISPVALVLRQISQGGGLAVRSQVLEGLFSGRAGRQALDSSSTLADINENVVNCLRKLERGEAQKPLKTFIGWLLKVLNVDGAKLLGDFSPTGMSRYRELIALVDKIAKKKGLAQKQARELHGFLSSTLSKLSPEDSPGDGFLNTSGAVDSLASRFVSQSETPGESQLGITGSVGTGRVSDTNDFNHRATGAAVDTASSAGTAEIDSRPSPTFATHEPSTHTRGRSEASEFIRPLSDRIPRIPRKQPPTAQVKSSALTVAASSPIPAMSSGSRIPYSNHNSPDFFARHRGNGSHHGPPHRGLDAHPCGVPSREKNAGNFPRQTREPRIAPLGTQVQRRSQSTVPLGRSEVMKVTPYSSLPTEKYTYDRLSRPGSILASPRDPRNGKGLKLSWKTRSDGNSGSMGCMTEASKFYKTWSLPEVRHLFADGGNLLDWSDSDPSKKAGREEVAERASKGTLFELLALHGQIVAKIEAARAKASNPDHNTPRSIKMRCPKELLQRLSSNPRNRPAG